MYNTEFSETRLEAVGIGSANFEEFSYEDKKFLEIIDENTTKVGSHYQLPLPLKNHGKFPNNRYLAEKRIHYLKGKFIKNPKFLWIIKILCLISSRKVMQRSQPKKFQKGEHGIFHTMECTTRADLGRSGWSLTAVVNSKKYP